MTLDIRLSPGDRLEIGTDSDGNVGTVLVTSVAANGQVIGKLHLTDSPENQAARLLRAANDAAEAFSFAAMDIEEANLAAIALRLKLPDGRTWKAGRDFHRLLITDNCTHIAFKLAQRA